MIEEAEIYKKHPHILISVIKATAAKINDFIKVTSQSFSQYVEIPMWLVCF